MRFIWILIVVIPWTGQSQMLFAQDQKDVPIPDPFSPILRIFANVHHGITPEDRSKAFEIRRVYLGYKYNLNEYFSTEIKLDIGSPDDVSAYSRLRRYAYFKTAALYWQSGKWKINAGIIDTEHFNLQEKYWKHRYIYKSFQDEHRFGPKADIGTTVSFTPGNKISIDASVMNGEGYINLQRDNTFKYSGGISIYPIPQILLRIYCDLEHKETDQATFSGFLGFLNDKISAGSEFNHKVNSNYQSGHHQTGLSGYISYDLNERFEVFGRYDHLSSNIPGEFTEPWNLADDGSALITGLQYMPIKNVRISVNYQDWVPAASNMESVSYIYLNLEVTL